MRVAWKSLRSRQDKQLLCWVVFCLALRVGWRGCHPGASPGLRASEQLKLLILKAQISRNHCVSRCFWCLKGHEEASSCRGWRSLADVRQDERLATAWEVGLPPWSWGSLAGQGTVLQRTIKILDFVLFAGKVDWLGSAGCPCSLLQPCNSSLYEHWHVACQRGSVFVKIPVCLGRLRLREAAGLKIWEELAAKETTWHCFCVCPCSSPLAVFLAEILLPSLAPLCLLAAELDRSELFLCSLRNPLYKYNC